MNTMQVDKYCSADVDNTDAENNGTDCIDNPEGVNVCNEARCTICGTNYEKLLQFKGRSICEECLTYIKNIR